MLGVLQECWKGAGKVVRGLVAKAVEYLTATIIVSLSAVAVTVWAWFGDRFGDVWHWGLQAPAFSNWAWLLMLLGDALAGSIIAWIIVRVGWRHVRKNRSPTVDDYTEDDLPDFRWRWRYHDGKPVEFQAYCPSCDTSLECRNYVDVEEMVTKIDYECMSCHAINTTFTDLPNGSRASSAAREVERKRRTGEWQTAVERAKERSTLYAAGGYKHPVA